MKFLGLRMSILVAACRCYYHRSMATAAISIAPVLTPQTIGALADNLERHHFEEKARSLRLLVPFLQGTVAECFAPLVQGTKKTKFKTRFDKLARDFEP